MAALIVATGRASFVGQIKCRRRRDRRPRSLKEETWQANR